MRRQWLPWRNHLSGSSCVAVGICSRASAATATRHGLAMMPPGHGPSWESGSAGAVRERRQTKEMTRRAVDEKDVPMAVYGWLELSVCRSGNARSHVDCALRKYTKQELPLTHDRSLGYRPHDRLSGYHEMWANDTAAMAALLRALRGAADAGDQWASWAMALRYWNGAGVEASPKQAIQHAREAATAGHVAAQVGLGDWLRRVSNSSADAADASEWLQKAATSGDAIATFMLERANWSPTKTTADHTMLWGSSRYNDVGFEGWGRLPLADFSDLDAASLIQLAEEHSLLPTGFGTSVDQQQQQQHILSCCREALTPRFVITLHEDPWIDDLQQSQMLTDWAHSVIGAALMAKERQLRLGVAAQLAESLWLHYQRVSRRSENESAAMNTDDDTCNPVVLSKLLRLDWVFIHISALVVAPAGTEGVDMTLTSDGIFTRCIELRYTLAEDSADAVAHGGMGVRGSGDANHRMREQFGSGRWGWDQGRHVAVEIDPFLANLKIRSVEVRG